jgi:murein DD-endopeptidase MepM/ murein hydrolase activator NlpD
MISSLIASFGNAFNALGALRRQASRLTKRRLFLSGTVVAIASALVLGSALTSTAQTYPVQVSPSRPSLGDTLSVVIQGSSNGVTPTVTVGDTTYQSFALSANRYRALIPTSPNTRPGRMTLQVTGPDGTNNVAVNVGDRSFETQYITLSAESNALEGTEYEFKRLDDLRALRTPERYWNGPMAKPSVGYVSSNYGNRRYYNGVFAEDYYHRGVDYAAGNGSPIYAPAAGRIVVVGREADGFELNGNTIGIDHGQGVTSVMIHLSGFAVNEGDMVEQGQLVGYMGATGFATGPNLHWGLFVNGISVDPVPWRYNGIE